MLKNDEKDVVHALAYSGTLSPLSCDVYLAKWTPECMLLMREIISHASVGASQEFLSIPTASLRSLLEININSLLLVPTYTGLKTNDLKFFSPRSEIKPFIVAKKSDDFDGSLQDCTDKWIDDHLVPFIEKHNLPDSLRENLFSLAEHQKLFQREAESFTLLPWDNAENGTAVPAISSYGYSITANDIARLLEGIEIFPGLPPVMRIIGSDLSSNKAELMTPIIDSFQEVGLFSLVCSISIETLPTVNYPLICFNFHRRRWVTSLKEKFSHNRNASAYIFHERNARAYAFNIHKSIEKKIGVWLPDDSIDALRIKFRLPATGSLVDVINLVGEEDVRAGVVHSHSSDGGGYAGKNKLGSGVTERDRTDAFLTINKRLAPFGFEIFNSFVRIKDGKQFLKATHLSYLDLVTFCMNINEDVITDDDSSDTVVDDPAISETFSIVDSLGNEWLEMISEYGQKLYESGSIAKAKKVDNMSDLNKVIIKDFFVDEKKPVLLYVCQDQKQQSVVKYIIQKLFADSIEVVTALLPINVHGPKSILPGADLKDVDRIQLRKESWEKYIENISRQYKVDMCLIHADKFYLYDGKPIAEDGINKIAAKIALSSAGIPTQYLNSPNTNKKKIEKKLEDYINRIRSALYDLVFGHHGIIPAVREGITTYFPLENTRPKFIYGLSLLKVNNRSCCSTGAELAVATRISATTGLPQVMLCYFGSQLHVTEWLGYTQAIEFLCTRYNIKMTLGKDSGGLTRKDIFQSFCKKVFKEANQENGVLFIDATHAKALCPWITDTGITSKNGLDPSAYPTLRIVRVRQQAPQVMIEKFTEDFATPTTCKRLFRITEGKLPIYWSVGLPLVTHKRGTSTYRSIELPHKGDTKMFAPYLKHYPTPNPVEFVVLASLAGESADELIQFSTSLRVGVLQANFARFVNQPAPLFIIRKLKEYLEL